MAGTVMSRISQKTEHVVLSAVFFKTFCCNKCSSVISILTQRSTFWPMATLLHSVLHKSSESHPNTAHRARWQALSFSALIPNVDKDSLQLFVHHLVTCELWAGMANSDPPHLSAQPTLYCTPSTAPSTFSTENTTTKPKPNQPPIQWVPGVCSCGVKWPRCDADDSPQSNVQVNTTSGPKHHLTMCTLMNAQGKLYL